MPLFLERALAVKEKAGPLQAPTYPDGLTRREVEMLCVIAAGKSNQETADELFLSVRTVGIDCSYLTRPANNPMNLSALFDLHQSV